MSETMWSGRFREPLDERFAQWQRSFSFDWRLLPYELAASRAHAHALAATGVLDRNELAAVLLGLEEIARSTRLEPLPHSGGSATSEARRALSSVQEMLDPQLATLHPEIEDVHHFVESALAQRIGTLALKLHTGRSRNEQVATDLKLYVRDAIDQAQSSLREWAAALIEQGTAAGEGAMPAYTHLQRAEPVLIAHWLLAYVSMVERDLSRLEDCRQRLNLCPLGSGAVAGATLQLDRTIAARELRFRGPTLNSMDATSDRDFAVEFAQVASQVGLHLSRFAEEITLFATAEYGFLDLPERFSTGSSAMPQKKNPDFAELIRGKSARLLGAATTLCTLVKGLPLAYNKDLQESQEVVFDVVGTLLPMLELLAPFTAALSFRRSSLEAAAGSGHLNAMAAATYLTGRGIPFRTAHEQIGAAVRYAMERGVELQELTLEELKRFGPAFHADFYEACSLRATLDSHDVPGGTAVLRVEEALRVARAKFCAAPEHLEVSVDVA